MRIRDDVHSRLDVNIQLCEVRSWEQRPLESIQEQEREGGERK